MSNHKFKLTLFVIYSLLYECLVLGGTGYAVFVLNHNGWWMALAMLASFCQLKPKHFGLTEQSGATL